MNHGIFEEWVLLDPEDQADNLSQTQLDALVDHLGTCQHCQQLSAARKEMELTFHRSPIVIPEEGFTSRWQVRLQAEHQKIQSRQALLVLAFCLAAIILLSGSLFLLVWPWAQTPDLVVWFWISRIINMLTIVGNLRDSLGIFVNTISGVIPFGGWVLLVGLASELAVLWLVSLRWLTNPRRLNL